jgi:hypothetical protein
MRCEPPVPVLERTIEPIFEELIEFDKRNPDVSRGEINLPSMS